LLVNGTMDSIHCASVFDITFELCRVDLLRLLKPKRIELNCKNKNHSMKHENIYHSCGSHIYTFFFLSFTS